MFATALHAAPSRASVGKCPPGFHEKRRFLSSSLRIFKSAPALRAVARRLRSYFFCLAAGNIHLPLLRCVAAASLLFVATSACSRFVAAIRFNTIAFLSSIFAAAFFFFSTPTLRLPMKSPDCSRFRWSSAKPRFIFTAARAARMSAVVML